MNHKIQVGHLELKYNHQGTKGPVLVMLHGYGGGPLDWHHLAPSLSQDYRLIIPNLAPLFSCETQLSFSKQVQLVGEFLNIINPQRESFVLVGSSYGGTLSFGLRAHFQSLVQGHVLINPMPLNPLPALKSAQIKMLLGMNMVPGALSLFLKTRMGKELLMELGGAFGFSKEGKRGLEGLSERKLILISKAVQRFAWIGQHENWAYWTSQLRDHVIPMLLMTGQNDPLFEEKDFRSFQNLVPMSEHLSVPQGEHLLVRTHAGLLSEHIRGFVRSLFTEPHLESNTIRHAI